MRGRTPDNGSYAADYDTLARLKEFSDTYGVTVLVVHHTRKEGAEDVFNMISGTNGLMGAADGALILYKDKRTASIQRQAHRFGCCFRDGRTRPATASIAHLF